jgi:REP element-mobilizing transposase RayT
MKYALDKGCHATYSIKFHYVCCVKYRRKVLTKAKQKKNTEKWTPTGG